MSGITHTTSRTWENTNDQPSPFCSVREFVARSGLSEKTVRKMVHERTIPYISCGNKFVIDYEGALNAIRNQARGL